MKFNVNDYVKVKLNEKGINIYLERNQHLRDMMSKYYNHEYVVKPPKIDEEGFTKFQMWDLMQLYGPYLGLGMDLPFETEILLEDKHGSKDYRTVKN